MDFAFPAVVERNYELGCENNNYFIFVVQGPELASLPGGIADNKNVFIISIIQLIISSNSKLFHLFCVLSNHCFCRLIIKS